MPPPPAPCRPGLPTVFGLPRTPFPDRHPHPLPPRLSSRRHGRPRRPWRALPPVCPTCLGLLLLLLGASAGHGAELDSHGAELDSHRADLDSQLDSQLNIRRAAPAPPSREAMHRWHGRYAPYASPVRRALVALLTARGEPRPARWEPGVRRACEHLAAELARFGGAVGQGGVFPVPDRASDFHLKRAFAALDDAARNCGREDYGAMEAALHRAAASWRQSEVLLARYGLRP